MGLIIPVHLGPIKADRALLQIDLLDPQRSQFAAAQAVIKGEAHLR